jgi:hypothetical protein
MENIESILKGLKDVGLVEFSLSDDRTQMIVGEPGYMSSIKLDRDQVSRIIAELIKLRNLMVE